MSCSLCIDRLLEFSNGNPELRSRSWLLAVDGSPQRSLGLYKEPKNVFFGIIAKAFAGGVKHPDSQRGSPGNSDQDGWLWSVEMWVVTCQAIPFLDSSFLKMENDSLVSEVIPALDNMLLHLVKEFIAFPFAHRAY